MALALYRTYRPASFAEVVGQDHVTEPLMQAIRTGRINHAYLFSGPRGCGKTSSARIMARSLNCVDGPTPTPCGVCDSCVGLAPDGPGSLDVIEIDAASHGGVEDARELRERAHYAPVSSRFKVYIVDEAHMVTTQGFNALLKLVEEPPDFLVFIFATTEPEKVLSTIRSRTHHYPFRLLPPTVMRGLLERICAAEQVEVEPAVFPLVVRAGGGSARDALSILDQLFAGAGQDGVRYARTVGLLGVTDEALLDDVVGALAAQDGAAVFQTVDRVVDAGHDPRRFAGDLLERLRDLIVLDAVPDAAGKGLLDHPADQLERMGDQAARLGTATLSRLADIVHIGLTEMRGTTSPRLLLELICARMLLPGASTDSGGLLQRLERLERRLDIRTDAPTIAGDPAAARGRRAGGDSDGGPAVLERGRTTAAGAADSPGRPAGRGSQAGGGAGTPSVERPSPPASLADRAAAQGAGTTARAVGAAAQAAGTTAGATGTTTASTTATAAGSTPPAAAGAEIDAAAVRQVWSELLSIVRRRRRATEALLTNATALSVDGGVLRLGIGSTPLMRLLSDPVNTEIVQLSLKDLLGVEWRIETVVQAPTLTDPQADEPDPRDEEPTSETPVRAAERDPEAVAISLVQSQLGARRIDSGD
ncbi:MAG: DNA polymerase III subunit gamma and tau [Geodermatophilaceae bacterium]|nr:DNA polymerase III subunit gamma and tau [Geodermatophilaceae bacterium]